MTRELLNHQGKPRIKRPVLGLPCPRDIDSRVAHDPAVSNLVVEAVMRVPMHPEHRHLEELGWQLVDEPGR